MAPENTYKWVQDRLRELHSGALSGDDLRRLHALAKEDPFIADALEGFSQHPGHPHDHTLDRLASRIRTVRRERRRWLIPNLTVTAVAASLMIIVGVWAVINRIDKAEEFADAETNREVQLNVYPDSGETAQSLTILDNETTQSDVDDKSTPPAIKEDDKMDDETGPSTSSSARPTSPPAARNERAQPKSSVAEEREPIAIVQDQPVHTTTETRVRRSDDDAADKNETATQLPAGYANAMPPSLLARRTTGRVISERGEPLIGVNLNIRNTNLSTASDLDGKFELFLPEPQSTVDITFSGYEGTSVELRQGEEDVAIQLPEIDIARHNAKTYNMDGVQASAGANAPQQTTYVDYLRNNSRYPLKDNLYTPGRDVTLQFDVAEDGKPSRVRITSSSNDRNLDEEALRLIRKGPVWTCEGNKFPCEMEYTIYFR